MLVDLHLHTKYSFDSLLEPDRVIRTALRRGLDAIAVTDHDTIEGALETRKIAEGRLLVIIGEEISTNAGDLLGLFLREPVNIMDPIAAVDAVHAQGGVAIVPHPFGKTLGISEEMARKIDGIEGYNSRYSPRPRDLENVGDTRALQFAAEYDLTLTSSSDAHRYRDIGRGRTLIPAANLEDVRQALLKGRTTLAALPRKPLGIVWDHVVDGVTAIVDPVPERMLYPKENA